MADKSVPLLRGQDCIAQDDDPYAGLDETTRYRAMVTQAVMAAIVDAGRVEGSGGGMVQLDVAFEGICDGIAALEEAAGVSTTPKDRRETADLCRRRIISTGTALANAAAAGKALTWSMEKVGPIN